MARPRTFDTDTASKSILEVFWEKGYEATSLSDLMAATELNKSSLYAAFGDKRAMYLRALTDYDLNYVEAATNMMAGLNGLAALQALLALPAMAAREGDKRGCFLCNASTEQDLLDDAAQRLAEKGRDKLRWASKSALIQAFGSDTCPDLAATMADEVLALYFGLRVLARSGFNPPGLQSIADAFIARLESN